MIHRKDLKRLVAIASIGIVCAISSTGCVLHEIGLIPPPVPPTPVEGIEIRGDDLTTLEPPKPGTVAAQVAGAHEFFRQGEYGKAQILFNIVSKDKKAPLNLVQESIFYEAECYRLQGRYPRAAETYSKLLKEYPNNAYREQAQQHAFQIANYWLDDTRLSMKEEKEVVEGKRWLVTPRFFNVDKTKPFADEEGRAVQLLELVHLNDINGEMSLGDHALFLAGGVAYHNREYEEADHFFTQIHERHGNSRWAPKAIEYAINAKNFSTGGPDYDGRKVAEARFLVHSAVRNYPELARNKKDFLAEQLSRLDLQQAAKEYRQAEFYRRRGKPASAYWCYHVVKRRYPKTEYAKLSENRIAELEAKHGPFRSPDSSVKVELPKPTKVSNPPEDRRPADVFVPPPPRPQTETNSEKTGQGQ